VVTTEQKTCRERKLKNERDKKETTMWREEDVEM
jgi:hypothetical protein